MASAIVRKQLLNVKFNESLTKLVEVYVEPPKPDFLEVHNAMALRMPVERGEYYVTRVEKILQLLPKLNNVVK